MPDYGKGKIYKIRSHQTVDVYVGSTCQRLCDRMSGHRRDYKRYKDGKYGYYTSFKILEYDDAYIELAENYPCLCREGLCQREGQVIRETDNCVNRCIAGRTKQEYYQDNIDKLKQYSKQYREDNKEHVKQYDKQYKEDNKEHLKQYDKQYREDNKDKMKQYREDNKNKMKQYYEDNKEHIGEIKKQKYECECGSRYTHANKSRHFKSATHREHEHFMSLTEEQVRAMLH